MHFCAKHLVRLKNASKYFGLTRKTNELLKPVEEDSEFS